MTIRALVPVADGSEEIEAVTIIDTLRRAEIEVTVAAVGARREVTCSRGVALTADALLTDTGDDDFDLVVLPGGLPGAEHLRDSEALTDLLRGQFAAGRLVGAICAAPAVVLQHHGLIGERRATCHPSLRDRLPDAVRSDARVVEDGQLITSGGPGTALEFALALVARLRGRAASEELAAAMLAS